jgi:serine protease Do
MHDMNGDVFTHVNRLPKVGFIDWDIAQDTWMVIAAPPIASNIEAMKNGEMLPGVGYAWNTGLDRASRLPQDQWLQGIHAKNVFREKAMKFKSSVISILNEDVPVGLGTVIDEGIAVVMASALPPKPRCRLPDGSVCEVIVIGEDRANDIAVIKVPAQSTQAIELDDIDTLPTGTMIASISPEGLPRTLGIVSVAPRTLADAHPPQYKLPLQLKADQGFLVLDQESKSGPGIQIMMPHGIAKVAGVKAGDRLTSVDGQPINSQDDFVKEMNGKRSGDVISAEVDRDGHLLSLRIPLLPEVEAGALNATWRSDDYPIAFEYSPPVRAIECGGPLLDLLGRVVGITVGRPNSHAGWAIPISVIRQIVADAKKGKLAIYPD